jgi:predicted ATPase/predicted MPP superfamily phosphohydrolase
MGAEEWSERPVGFLDAFWRDLERMHAESGPLDAVFFTGDFVYQGRTSEYANCTILLDNLFDHLHKMGSKPTMFCVPGNHDLVRSQETVTLADAPDYAWREDGIKESFLWRAVRNAFEPYDAWAARWRFPRARWGTVLGDFGGELTKEELSVGVIGLNTSINQGRSGASKWIPVNRRRIESIAGGSVEQWAEQHRLRILLAHHPVWDFSYSDSLWTMPIGRGGIQLHFCGHLHEVPVRPIVIDSSLPVIEALPFSRGSQGDIGYVMGKIDLNDLSKTTLWYRIFSSKSREWRSAHELEEKFVIPLPTKATAVPAFAQERGSESVALEIAKPNEQLYLQSLHLENFKCFDELKLNFAHDSRLEGQWTCIAGINGAGKSSILQAIGLALLGNSLGGELLTERLNRMRRFVDGQRQRACIRVFLRVPASNRGVPLQLELGEIGVVAVGNHPWPGLRSRVIAAYGATRNLSSRIDEHEENLDVQRQMTLFEPLRRLAHADVLLKGPMNGGDPFWRLLGSVLNQVFDGDIRLEFGHAEPRFDVGGKDVVGALELPDGFRACVGWLADLCKIWCEKQAELAQNANPRDMQAIVLIDEIDLHLHPALQRKLVPKLRATMPQVQWIVTTHSPLVLANFDRNEIIALDRSIKGNVRRLDRQILGWRSDEIYDWLMETEPTGAAGEEILRTNDIEGKPSDEEVAELLRTSPTVSDAEARERVQKLKGVIQRLKP